MTQQAVSDWIGGQIQFYPLDEIERRQAAGEPPLGEAVHPLADKAHSHYPAVISGWEPGLASRMLDIFDPVPAGEPRRNGLVLRDFVNIGQLTEAGEYTGAGREQFLTEWLDSGGRAMFVIASMYNESPGVEAMAGSTEDRRAWLDQVGPSAQEAARRVVRLMHRLTPDQRSKIVALETMNEPAIYHKGSSGEVDFGLEASDLIDMFESDQASVARAALDEGLPGHVPILFPKYGYSGRADELLVERSDGTNMVGRWYAEFGARMAISAHLYPGWKPGGESSIWTGEVIDELEKIDLPTVVTETNWTIHSEEGDSSAAAISGWHWHEVVRRGFPVMLFPLANSSGGSILDSAGSITPNEVVRKPDRLFTYFCVVSECMRGNSPLDVTLDILVVRSELDNSPSGHMTSLRLIRASGEIVLSGSGAVILAAGPGGNTITLNPDEWCWVATGTGNDTVHASAGPGAVVSLGPGVDTVHLGAENLRVHGLGGGDIFVLNDSGLATIYGFDVGVDVVDTNGLPVASRDEGEGLILSVNGTDRAILLGCAGLTLEEVSNERQN